MVSIESFREVNSVSIVGTVLSGLNREVVVYITYNTVHGITAIPTLARLGAADILRIVLNSSLTRL